MKFNLRLKSNPRAKAELDKIYVCFELPRTYETEAEALRKLNEGMYSLEIKKLTGNKTKAQNAYIWELLTEIGKAMNPQLSPTEAYRRLIVDSSNYVIGAFKYSQYPEYKRTWELNGKGWIVEILFEHNGWIETISYYGLSAWNKEQASAFIDTLIMECEDLNIPFEKL